MQTKIILWKTPKSAAGFARYMQDLLHPNHAGAAISSRYINCDGPMELQLAVATTAFEEQPIRRGPRLRTCAVEVEGSTPKGVELTPAERRLVEQALVESLGLTMCLVSWHSKRPKNKKKWREDFHVLTPNKDTQGRPLTSRSSGNLMLKVRAIVDRVHQEINQARRRHEQPHIPTMPEIQGKRLSKERAFLIRQLAETTFSLTPLNIVSWLRTQKLLGKRFPKTDDCQASVSIVYPLKGKPQREPLKDLISDVLALRQQQRQAQVSTAKKTLSPSTSIKPPLKGRA